LTIALIDARAAQIRTTLTLVTAQRADIGLRCAVAGTFTLRSTPLEANTLSLGPKTKRLTQTLLTIQVSGACVRLGAGA
jgi:hypothetical protein